MKELALLLKKFFGFDSFRPLQAEIVQRIIQKKDSLVLMPTGGGKSVCFQLPAIYLPGTAIVISPLIALMKDQVEGLMANGIPAAALNSMMPEAEKQRIKQHAIQGKIKLLYISPEGLISEIDWLLPRLEISLIAIDEAHCISHWGHDFRPEYTQLSVLKERFPDVPVVALTATADKITRSDIVEQLKLHSPQVFISSFDRPNLSLTVYRGFAKKEKIAAIVRFIHLHKGQSGIIYCMKRADTEAVAETLNSYQIRAIAYHAGLPPAQREKAQNDFINDRTEVVCATVAFGMGIDKSNVRWVIHYNMPGSIENYYQEIGRAGRDGLRSDTLLFYSLGDLVLLRRFADESGQNKVNLEKLNRMQRYCEADICRRRILLNYFGEEAGRDCGNCDVCKNPPQRFDGSVLVQKALSAILRTQERVGIQMLIDILRASGRSELVHLGYHLLKTYGAGRDLPYNVWKEYIYQMLQLGYIEIDYANAQTLKVTSLGRKVLYGEIKALLATWHEPEELKRPSRKEKKAPQTRPAHAIESDSADEKLMDALRQLRKQIAQQEAVPAYIIFSDAALQDMVFQKPLTMEAFAGIRGVGDVKLEKYGKTFTTLIQFVVKGADPAK
ncbi:MAG: DNA helicase RecQ [Tannerellaceae bacterium]|jgi:ATP-dependent DNA helicase RecQ|nr:DNA helicase RecQ [Tannerellaceae bacterium]